MPAGSVQAQRHQIIREQASADQLPAQVMIPQLRQDQYDIATDPAKIKVLAMGRRWGKSVLGGAISLTVASGGDYAAWVVPTYKNGRKLWAWIENAVRPLRKRKLCTVNRQDRTIDFANGGFFGMYSADNPDAIRGEAFHVVIVDEASRVAEEVIEDVIIPTLADYNGDLILISTPHGKNYFWRLYVAGQNPKHWDAIRSWHAPSSANPNPHIKAAYAAAKARAEKGIKVLTFRQEWNAEFVGDGNEVFRNIEAALGRSVFQAGPISGHEYAFGIDWARSKDYTVIMVLDITLGEICYYERHQGMGYEDQFDLVVKLYRKWQPVAIIAESNTLGGPMVERLEAQEIPVWAIFMNNPTKQALVDDLASAFENESIGLPDDEDIREELQLYESTKLKTGMVRYAAAGNGHDDIVTALLLVNQAAVVYSEDEQIPRTAGEYQIPAGYRVTEGTRYAQRI
jgi:hypothetical protein